MVNKNTLLLSTTTPNSFYTQHKATHVNNELHDITEKVYGMVMEVFGCTRDSFNEHASSYHGYLQHLSIA